jgi:RNA ligase
MSIVEFLPFAKIPRMRRTVCVTEKIDGTNAAVQIRPMADLDETGSPLPIAVFPYVDQHGTDLGMHGIWAQSRNNFITPNKDNYGFATWVSDNAQELIKLGPGAHYGEWWGYGIQRGYIQQVKRFSLFNVNRYGVDRDTPPDCCGIVPVLGYVEHDGIQALIDDLKANGSKASPGFMHPEGVVVYHTQSRQLYKILIEGDDAPKSLWTAAAAKAV